MELVGLGALLSAIVEALKKFGVIPDGYGGLAAVIINIIVFTVATLAGFFQWDLAGLDKMFMMVAELLLAILGSFVTHKIGRAMKIW